MARSLNGSLLGRAAHTEWQDLFDRMNREAEVRRVQAVCQRQQRVRDITDCIRSMIGEEAYREWWNAAPEDNDGFDAAADTLLLNLMGHGTPLSMLERAIERDGEELWDLFDAGERRDRLQENIRFLYGTDRVETRRVRKFVAAPAGEEQKG
jgi:hypothetical protein